MPSGVLGYPCFISPRCVSFSIVPLPLLVADGGQPIASSTAAKYSVWAFAHHHTGSGDVGAMFLGSCHQAKKWNFQSSWVSSPVERDSSSDFMLMVWKSPPTLPPCAR